MLKAFLILMMIFGIANISKAQSLFEKDIFQTSEGELEITFIGHGTLMFSHQGQVVHVDPYGQLANYTQFPKADIILLTHEHSDHMDLNAINLVRKKETQIILTEKCAETIRDGFVMKNGDIKNIEGLRFEAVPAYNILHKRANGQPFHPKGDGNGYLVQLADLRIYVAGDTENIPEMKNLKDVDIAFLPMNLPYTMTPEMVASAAKMIKPKILYPYHFGETNTGKLLELLNEEKEIEIRIRKMS